MGKTKEKATHPIRDQIEMIIFAIVMALGLKVFALEAYEIPTGSMQPTLMGCDLLDARTGQATRSGIHDRVLVDKTLFLTRDPERWEVCVFRYPLATSNNYVKRLVGMPGEELWVQHGDIWARDSVAQGDFKIQRKPWSVQQHLWKRVYPSATVEPAQWSGWHTVGKFTRDDAGVLDLTGRCSIETRATIRDEYRHGYSDKVAMQIPVAGGSGRSRHPVSDLRATFRFTPLAGAEDLTFELDYGNYELTLAFKASQSKWFLRSGGKTLSESPFGFEVGQEIEFDLAFWDHTTRLSINDDEFLMTRELDMPAKASTRNGMRIHTSSGGWQIQPGEIWRDIHYISPLNGGTPLFTIPKGEYFMMGDNTQNSLDSRDWTARQLTFGDTVLRGDSLRHGSDPFFDNPRWNNTRSMMTFRDQFGNLHTFDMDDLAKAQDTRVPISTVPRDYIIGKALAVFLPIPPMAPIVRVGLVH